ncbi:MAG: nuclear transport factor 2 family protein [Pseudomonadota bacterium]
MSSVWSPATATWRAARGVRPCSGWWEGAHEVHDFSASDPVVNGDQFMVNFKMDVTQKDSGQRMQMDEQALYTVRNGKIAEERFFYPQPG